MAPSTHPLPLAGRRDELALFERVLADGEPARVLHLRGPGGIGKTELLKAFVRRSRALGIPVACLDGRDLLPTRRAVREALAQGWQAQPAGAPTGYASSDRKGAPERSEPVAPDLRDSRCGPARPVRHAKEGRRAVVIDELDELGPVLHHLPDLLEEVGGDTVVVLAGRDALPLPVRAAPEWAARLRSLLLGPLSPGDAARVLDDRGVAPSLHETIVGKAHGNPLALVLYAELARQVGAAQASRWSPTGLGDDPGLVHELLSHLVRTVPDGERRSLLEVAAFLPEVTETTVRALVGTERSGELFAWLCRLSFVDLGKRGAALHPLVRDALIADLRWRDPARCWWLLGEVAGYHLDRAATEPPHVWAPGIGLVLARSRGLAHTIDSRFVAAGETEPAEPTDWPAIHAMVREHEGERSVELLEYWRGRGAPAVVVRDPEGAVLAFVLEVRLDGMGREEAAQDPGVAAAHRVVEGWGLPEDRPVLYFRFWMARDTYQSPSPAQARIYHIFSVRLLETNRVAAGISAHHDPALLRDEMMGSANQYLEGADFEVEGRSYGCQVADCRDQSALEWLRATVAAALGPMPVADLPPVDLGREDFEEAVGEALRYLRSPDDLGISPMAHSRVILSRTGPVAPAQARGMALSEVVRAQCLSIRDDREAAELGEVLVRTFLDSPSKQLAVAADLGMSYATYRRRLREAVRLLARRLWALEHGGPAGADEPRP